MTTLTLTHSKSTKGTHVYAGDTDDAPIPSVYIKRSAFPTAEAPKTIKITLDLD